jgi:hypothetical protein
MIALDTPKDINLFRMMSLKGALRLEVKGMKRRGRSAYSIVKEEFALKGNKQRVLEQFTAIVEKMRKDTNESNKQNNQ